MTHIRLKTPSPREFQKDVYRPGVISLSRILWGSLGGGLILVIVAAFSETFRVQVLYPPLAATCFINAACVYSRLARPKPVIVGHFVSCLGGLAGSWAGALLATGTIAASPMKLGLAVLFASVLMQIFDADHPPAAATAAIAAFLPLPTSPLLLPLHMAWGATIVVFFALVWNRVWFEFPAPEVDSCVKHAGLFMEKPQIWGTIICLAAFTLMCFKPWVVALYWAGLVVMMAGVLVLTLHHFPGLSPLADDDIPVM
ncbi:MAG: HPP family protein [Desulfomonilaceae bacterium]